MVICMNKNNKDLDREKELQEKTEKIDAVNEKRLIPDDDFDYERKRFEDERDAQERYEKELSEYNERKEQERKDYEKQLESEKIELVKLKTGVIDESDIIKEETSAPIKLSKGEWIKNFWWHHKFIIMGIILAVAVVSYITYDTVSRVKPDIKIIMTVNNGLVNRTEEVADYFEKFCPDINGDGEVKVQILSVPLPDNTDDYVQIQQYQEVYLANMQTGEIIFILTDDKTDTDIYSENDSDNLLADVSPDFKDNKFVTNKGLSLRGDYIEKVFKYQTNYPQDMYLGMRAPIKTLKDSKEDMQENYDKAYEIFKAMAEDIKENTTEADKASEASSSAETTIQKTENKN